MAYSDKLLQDTKLTEQSILQDLEALSLYYEDIEIPAKMIQASKLSPMPSLVALLDSGDEDKPWVLTHSFLPLGTDMAEFTKFLQFYCELSGSLEKVERLTLLEAVNRLNQALPFGSVLLVEPRPQFELPLMAAVRAVQGFPLDRPIDQGTFTEDLFLFEMSCELVARVLDELADGKSLDEVFEQIGQ